MLDNGPKKKVTIIIPERIIEAMRALAKEHRRSFNAEILWALDQYLNEEDQAPE